MYMKILDTKGGKFGRFIKKNGSFVVLAVVAIAICVALFAVGAGINQSLVNNNSEVNLSGDENNWNSNSNQDALKTDTQTSSTTSSLQQEAQQSSSKPSDSQNSQSGQNSSQTSQPTLFISPVNGKILNKYSGNKPVKNKTLGDWRLHTGIDYAAEKGTSVKASGEGIVSKIYNDSMWGTTVEISHPNNIVTIYSSLSDKTSVEKGQTVSTGQIIGTVANTAKIETAEGVHLHFAVKQNGKFINPETIITKPVGK